jgi:hypothetical protein
MRPEDLIPAFSDELRELDTEGEYADLIMEASGLMDLWCETDDEEEHESDEGRSSDILEELFDALDSFSPPYCYFGASKGDGACYGWWVSLDSLEDDCRYGEVLKVSDLAQVPDDYTGMILEVNDHGNATLYTAVNGKLEEVWGVV